MSNIINTKNTALLLKAITYSAEAHQGHRLADGTPQINKNLAVANVLANKVQVSDTATLIVALLQDTVTIKDFPTAVLEKEFGEDIVGLLHRFTEDRLYEARQLPSPAKDVMPKETALLKLANLLIDTNPSIITESPIRPLAFGTYSSGILVFAALFAAHKHRNQRRKDLLKTPYINHPVGVAQILCEEAQVDDLNVLIAALLHDTVEDTDTTFTDIVRCFGADIADIVFQVTDDRSLTKSQRKRLQVEHIHTMRTEAILVKMADKLYNMRDLLRQVPKGWSVAAVQGIFVWSYFVVGQIKGVNAYLEAAIACMWASVFKIDGVEYPTIPTDKTMEKALEEYYVSCDLTKN